MSPLVRSRNRPEPTRAHPPGPGRSRRPPLAAGLLLAPAPAGCGGRIGAGIAGRDGGPRLLGIDAPESATPGAPVDCDGPEASRRAAALLPAAGRLLAGGPAVRPEPPG